MATFWLVPPPPPNVVNTSAASSTLPPLLPPHCRRCFLHTATLLGALVAMEKIAGPTTILPFLGLILDFVCPLPEKLQEILHLLQCRLVGNPHRYHEARAAFLDWQALICSKSSARRPPVPPQVNYAQYNRDPAPSPHLPYSQCLC